MRTVTVVSLLVLVQMIWIRRNKSEHARSLPRRTILVGIATLLLCVGGSAEDTLEPGAAELDALRVFLEAAAQASEESLQTQIERLGSQLFLTRERASETIRSLALIRPEVVEALEGLKDSPDPEVAARSQKTLARVRRDGEGGGSLFRALARVSRLRPEGFASALTRLVLAADGDRLRLGWIRDALCAVAGQPESTTHLLSRLPDMPPDSAAHCVLLQAIIQSAAPEAERDAAAEQLRRMEKEAPHLADLLTFMDFSAEQVLRWKLDGDATDSGIHDLHGKTRDTRPADDRHGREGKALQFVGTRTSVSHPDHPLLDLGSRWSILLWIKPEEPVAEAGLVQKWGPTKPERNGYALCFGSNAKTVKIYANAEYPRRYQQASARTDLSGKWHFVAATYDGQLLSIFLNGKLESSTAVPLPPPANGHPLRVGSDPYSSSRTFRGAMDDLIIYRRSLSPFEIAQAHGIMEEGDLPEGS